MIKNLAQFIDHTLLKANATQEQIRALCEEAKQYGFASVCVNPTWVSFAISLLQGTGVKVCAVVGFPLGANAGQIKAAEAALAVADGAQEIDMVLNIGALKSEQTVVVANEIALVRAAIPGVCLKVIIETSLLTDDEKALACIVAVEHGADFVKTSTGFATDGNPNPGATVNDVRLMRQFSSQAQVKASGGVRTAEDVAKMLDAGATRIGTSNGVAIVTSVATQSVGAY